MDRLEDDQNDNTKININFHSLILGNSPLSNVIRIFYYLLSLFAAYVCFKIHKGFSLSIILALLFSPLYLIYVYAKYGKKPFKLK
jgi:hypothetical protein